MIVDPILVRDKNPIVVYLRKLKETVESTFEKRFIYYFVSRPKVRFDVGRPPRQTFFTNTLVVNFLVGKYKTKFKVKLKLPKEFKNRKVRVVLLEDKFIQVFYSKDHSETFSVHDFIRVNDIRLGLGSRVHYVGITKNPEDRPLSRKHRGIADTLYKFSSGEYDFFVVVNLYKVIARTVDSSSGITFLVGNSWTDEVLVGLEGEIIEHSLVAYFNSPIQLEKKSRERAALEKSLHKIKSEKNIVSVLFDLEIDSADEYWHFFSEEVSLAKRHVFSYEFDGAGLTLKKLGSDFDTEKFFNEIQ